MPPLDHATLQAVLDKQGMPNTTENLNRIAQFAAVAPDMLDKYLGRGTDQSYVDSGAGTNAAIDRSIASTADPRLANLAGPNPYSATLDPNTGLTNIGPGLVRTSEPTGRGGGGRPAGIPGDFNAPVGAPPFTKQGVTPPTSGTTQGYEPSTGAPMPVPSGAEAATRPPNVNAPREGGNWSQYIVPTILALAAGKFAHKQMGGATPTVPAGATTPTLNQAIPPTPAPVAAAAAPNAPAPANAPYMPPPTPSGPASVPGGVPQKGPVTPGPQPYTGGPTGPHNPPPPNNQPPYMPPPNAAGQTPADIDAIRQQIKAENDAAALQQEIKNRQPKGKTKAQQDTEATAEAARRATGRK